MTDVIHVRSFNEATYIDDVVQAGHQYQLRLADFFEDQGFKVDNMEANDSRFPDIHAKKKDLDLYIEAKSSRVAPITSLRAISYYPPKGNGRFKNGRFLINERSIDTYGAEGAQLIHWINKHPQILSQANELCQRIAKHFETDFDVIGKDTFSKYGDKGARHTAFVDKANAYKKQYATEINELHTVARVKNDRDSKHQGVVMTMPIGKVVNRIFSRKFEKAVDGETTSAVPFVIIGNSKGDQVADQLKWFEFAMPTDEQAESIRDVVNPLQEKVITSASPGKLEIMMKIRFDQHRQQFDVGIVLYLD